MLSKMGFTHSVLLTNIYSLNIITYWQVIFKTIAVIVVFIYYFKVICISLLQPVKWQCIHIYIIDKLYVVFILPEYSNLAYSPFSNTPAI